MPRIVMVQCTFTIPVEVADIENPEFTIEDNGCPGTGPVGAALAEHMEKHEAEGTCWACALNGECKIIDKDS
jgi:hypothetical protein